MQFPGIDKIIFYAEMNSSICLKIKVDQCGLLPGPEVLLEVSPEEPGLRGQDHHLDREAPGPDLAQPELRGCPGRLSRSGRITFYLLALANVSTSTLHLM